MRQNAQYQGGGERCGLFGLRPLAECEDAEQAAAKRQRIVEGGDVVHRLEVGDVDEKEQAGQTREYRLAALLPDDARE